MLPSHVSKCDFRRGNGCISPCWECVIETKRAAIRFRGSASDFSELLHHHCWRTSLAQDVRSKSLSLLPAVDAGLIFFFCTKHSTSASSKYVSTLNCRCFQKKKKHIGALTREAPSPSCRAGRAPQDCLSADDWSSFSSFYTSMPSTVTISGYTKSKRGTGGKAFLLNWVRKLTLTVLTSAVLSHGDLRILQLNCGA